MQMIQKQLWEFNFYRYVITTFTFKIGYFIFRIHTSLICSLVEKMADKWLEIWSSLVRQSNSRNKIPFKCVPFYV